MKNSDQSLKKLESLENKYKEMGDEIKRLRRNLETKDRVGLVTETLTEEDTIYFVLQDLTGQQVVSNHDVPYFTLEAMNSVQLAGNAFWDKASAEYQLESRLFRQEFVTKVKELNSKYNWVANFNNTEQYKYCFLITSENNIVSFAVQSNYRGLPIEYYFPMYVTNDLIEYFGHRLRLLF
jgi:hypothetical protein